MSKAICNTIGWRCGPGGDVADVDGFAILIHGVAAVASADGVALIITRERERREPRRHRCVRGEG